jgi:hypothetical protein
MIAADCTHESKMLDKQIFRQLAANVTRGQQLAAAKALLDQHAWGMPWR